MKAGSMEGLIGASVNLKLTSTPMRVYKEAERRGDTGTMERAMGYVTDFQEKAQKYSDKAQEELAKELKEERREQEVRREQAVEKRKEETKEYMEKARERNASDMQGTDSAEISEEGKDILKNNTQTDGASMMAETADAKMYASDGKPVILEPGGVAVDAKVGE